MAQQIEQQPTPRKILRRWIRVWSVFIPFSRRHRTALWFSALSAVFVVACRLALPWPLKLIIAPILGVGEGVTAPDGGGAPAGPALWGAVFLLLAVGLGWAELLQRLWVARFSIGWVRDIRAEVFRATQELDARNLKISTGDLVSRLVGDTARLKAGLQGFMTHIATNGLLYVGVTVILSTQSLLFGAIFFLVGILLLMVTWIGARRVFLHYRIFRKKEGKLANRIESALSMDSDQRQFAKVNYSSGVHEATVVQIQGSTSLAAHTILAIAILAALWIGVGRVHAGELAPDALLLFLLYALTLHPPSVRLARQGTRVGKMMACGDRLERLLREARRSRDLPTIQPLQRQIDLRSLSLKSGRADRRRNRLRKVSTVIRKGERLAVLGGSGAGKTTLLDMIAARVAPSRGKLLWDDCDYLSISSQSFQAHITYLKERPLWPRRSLESLLPAATPEEAAERDRIMDLCGAGRMLERLPNGYQTPLASHEISPDEARSIALAGSLLHCKQVLLLDDPFESVGLTQTRKILEYLAGLRDHTIIIAMTRPKGLDWFDRVLVLNAGELVFDGSERARQLHQGTEIEP
jgi:ABC-type multidrug transport system fused ATPase/permease subunit